MKKLLICPTCEIESKTNVFKWVGVGYGVEVRRIPFILGEINDSGQVVVKRSQHGYTVVGGDNFTIYCQKCGQPAYRKEVQNGTIENSSFRFKWFSGGSVSQETGTVGTPSF